MEETVQTTVNFVISLIGFIGTIGMVFGIPVGIILLIVGLNRKDKVSKKRYIIWALVLMLLPPFLIIGTLISFAVLNNVMGA